MNYKTSIAALFAVLCFLPPGCNRPRDIHGADQKTESQWGNPTNGLKCRLYFEHHRMLEGEQDLWCEIRNVTGQPITFPAVSGWSPVALLKLVVQGHPDVKTPPSSDEAYIRPRVIDPGQSFRFALSDGYILAFGTYDKEKGWVPFDPGAEVYHAKAIVEVDEQVLRGYGRALQAKQTVFWTGRIESNVVALRFADRPWPGGGRGRVVRPADRDQGN